jgi:RHS repeat-associated protein
VGPDGTVVERYAYDPYGQVIVLNGAADPDGQEWTPDPGNASDVSSEVLYAGYRFDPETGLYQVRHRSYHPTLGRWTSRDPAGYVDAMNLYQYCGGAPTPTRDPTGLGWLDSWFGPSAEAKARAERNSAIERELAAVSYSWDEVPEKGNPQRAYLPAIKTEEGRRAAFMGASSGRWAFKGSGYDITVWAEVTSVNVAHGNSYGGHADLPYSAKINVKASDRDRQGDIILVAFMAWDDSDWFIYDCPLIRQYIDGKYQDRPNTVSLPKEWKERMRGIHHPGKYQYGALTDPTWHYFTSSGLHGMGKPGTPGSEHLGRRRILAILDQRNKLILGALYFGWTARGAAIPGTVAITGQTIENVGRPSKFFFGNLVPTMRQMLDTVGLHGYASPDEKGMTDFVWERSKEPNPP